MCCPAIEGMRHTVIAAGQAENAHPVLTQLVALVEPRRLDVVRELLLLVVCHLRERNVRDVENALVLQDMRHSAFTRNSLTLHSSPVLGSSRG